LLSAADEEKVDPLLNVAANPLSKKRSRQAKPAAVNKRKPGPRNARKSPVRESPVGKVSPIASPVQSSPPVAVHSPQPTAKLQLCKVAESAIDILSPVKKQSQLAPPSISVPIPNAFDWNIDPILISVKSSSPTICDAGMNPPRMTQKIKLHQKTPVFTSIRSDETRKQVKFSGINKYLLFKDDLPANNDETPLPTTMGAPKNSSFVSPLGGAALGYQNPFAGLPTPVSSVVKPKVAAERSVKSKGIRNDQYGPLVVAFADLGRFVQQDFDEQDREIDANRKKFLSQLNMKLKSAIKEFSHTQ
jgi:hypothetical protein